MIKHNVLRYREAAVWCEAVSSIIVNYALGASGADSLICPYEADAMSVN